jgi:methionine synthase II (cobalamin-independent)
VGSLLRPPALLEARRRREDGSISAEDLRAVEDQAIAAAVKGQQDAGRFVGSHGGHGSADGFGLMVLEPGDELRRRVDAAAELVGLDRLALSPQCGFASVAEGGNLLSEDEQFAKLRLVAETARAIWG